MPTSAPADPVAALRGRRVVLGVTGGIAAYKAVEVCRRLVDAGAHVAPVLTDDALRFVGALTFSALASEPARTSLFDGPDPIPHTRLGQSADVVVVAPATAKLLGKYAAGISDDLLTATLLATRAPVLVAPAMHTEMWEHPAVRENLATLRRRGVHVVDPERGRLAGGDEGEGRLADPARIVAGAADVLARGGDLAGLHVLVTAGGTREPLDPVRFVGNRSSGKMGHAVADAAALRGAAVTLVTTTNRLAADAVEVVRVDTADEMADAVLARFAETDVVVMAAAVADFRPKARAHTKLKKCDGVPEVVLEPTPDILTALGERKAPHQLLIGFAAETDRVREQAMAKLAAKRVDLMVANDVSAADAGFEVDTNRAILLYSSGSAEETPLMAKRDLADLLLDRIAARLAGSGGGNERSQ
ncbi:MAG TPA: bifunctional phosphopantothenoylcysteine decarboxylase/phosphopantothenate--cysteine ligase CoaBC [Acidimicrobiia bacterium]